jgi:Transglutaminase-like superfamily
MPRAWSSRRPRRLPARAWALLGEAGACLAIARLATLLLPFRVVARRLGPNVTDEPPSGPASPAARPIGWALAAAARRAPWRALCLEQALAAKMMLRRRGITSTMYLGVATHPVKAHAWVRVGDVNVTGGSEVDRFAVVATFADAARR